VRGMFGLTVDDMLFGWRMFGLTVDAMLLCEGNVWADSG
jgi:hypothetical protein